MALMERNTSILDQHVSKTKENTIRPLYNVARDYARAIDAGDVVALSQKESIEATEEMERLMKAANREATKLSRAARHK